MSAGWCKKGAFAKTAEGTLGVVKRDPDSHNEVRLVRTGDETIDYIKADTLVQAQASDAGYAALAQKAPQLLKGMELAVAAHSGRHQDVARLIAEGANPDAMDGDGYPALVRAGRAEEIGWAEELRVWGVGQGAAGRGAQGGPEGERDQAGRH